MSERTWLGRLHGGAGAVRHLRLTRRIVVIGAMVLGTAWAVAAPGLAHAATGQTLTVSSCGNDATVAGTLPYEVAQASSDTGDTIQFSLDCSGANQIALSATLAISSSMTIDGNQHTVVLDGSGIQLPPPPALQSTADIVVNSGANVVLTDLTIQGGMNAGNGGGIVNQAGATLTLNSSVVAGDSAHVGGGIANTGGTLNVNNSTFTGNSANGDGDGGGAIENDSGGTANITASTFTGNSANSQDYGGAIENTGGMSTLNVNNSTFTRNVANHGDLTALDPGSSGGAIANFFGGTANITASTFTGNSAYGGGGAILNTDTEASGPTVGGTSTLTITSSTFASTYGTTQCNACSNNDAFAGGAIFNYSGGVVSITASTLVGNLATNGEAIDNDPSGGPVSIGGSIVANAFGGNCVGAITDQGYNLEWSGLNNPDTCVSSAHHDVTGTDPQLGALAGNGGPTQTRALQAGSPAIDAGPPAGSCPSTDQRGTSRPDNGEASCDIGAYEFVDPQDNDLGLTGVPNNMTVNATSPQGAVVTYAAPTATDESGDSPAAIVGWASSAMCRRRAARAASPPRGPRP